MIKHITLCTMLVFEILLGSLLLASDLNGEVYGQAVYVPIYSHIYGGPKSRPLNLTATLSIRNTDHSNPINITAIDYYDSDGNLVKKYINDSITLVPMASKHYIVQEHDTSGGSGANFVVRWNSDKKVSLPIIQAVHIGTGSGQGISFITFGRITKSPPE